MRESYKTKQKDLILEFIKSKKSGHISAENIIDHFKKLAEKDSSITLNLKGEFNSNTLEIYYIFLYLNYQILFYQVLT